MPRKKSKARKPERSRNMWRLVRLIRIKDDGIRPGRIVAAAEYVGKKVNAC